MGERSRRSAFGWRRPPLKNSGNLESGSGKKASESHTELLHKLASSELYFDSGSFYLKVCRVTLCHDFSTSDITVSIVEDVIARVFVARPQITFLYVRFKRRTYCEKAWSRMEHRRLY